MRENVMNITHYVFVATKLKQWKKKLDNPPPLCFGHVQGQGYGSANSVAKKSWWLVTDSSKLTL